MTQEEKKEPAKATFPTTTLGKLGNKLPVETKGKPDQFFSFIEWGTVEEKKIAKIKDKNPSMGRFITDVLMILTDKINGEAFAGQDEKIKILKLNQLPLANPLYMYFYLRFDQMGEELALNCQCPSCSHLEENFVASLGDLDVDCKLGEWDDNVNYKLKKPITLEKGEQLINNLNIKVGVWDIMERMDSIVAQDSAETKIYTLKNHIAGSEGFVGYLNADEVVQKIKKVDLERLQRLIAQHNAGPSLQQQIECRMCKFKFYTQLNWSYDSFFGASSLPQV